MGRNTLISHARGKKHTSRVVLSVKKEQHTLAAFWHPETEQSDGQTKCSYLIRFGLAPYFEKEVLDMVTKPESLCVVSFDESFNKIIQQEQMRGRL